MHATVMHPGFVARVRTYASFVRFEHTLFSLPLILAGVFSVSGPALTLWRWCLLGLAAVAARTAAMALNRLIDRRLDALNPRTRVRELASGKMRSPEAWTLLVASVTLYLAACASLGHWYLVVAAVPLAVFTLYPYLKRFTPFCHFGVGVALALAPLAGYAAAHPDLAELRPALLLAAFALVWVSGFDIIYATLDEAFDRQHGVHSMVAWLGNPRALGVSAALHRAAEATLLVLAIVLLRAHGRSAWSMAALPVYAIWVGTVVLLELEQRWAEDVNLAFFRVNVWVGAFVLALVLAARAAAGGF